MDERRLKRVAFGLCFVVSLFVPLACVIEAAEQPFQDSGKIVVALHTEITTMDPAEAFLAYECMITGNTYEGLLRYDLRDFSIHPLLAESWKLDENGGTFRLRKGVKFHDGTEFNAEAVRFNWKRIMAILKGPATWLKDIKDMKVVDDYTVRIETTKNWAFLTDVLATHRILVMASPTAVSKHATKEDPWAVKWFHDHTCGTGPYMAVEWVPNQYVKMVRNKDYWKGWSGKHFSEAVYQTAPEVSTRLMLIKSGNVDLILHMTAEHFEELSADPNINVTVVSPSFAVWLFLMNNAHGIFTDKNLRQAVIYTVDYDACYKMMKARSGGMLFGPIEGYKRDLKKAMEYKNKSAYAGKNVEVLITYNIGSEHKDFALILQDSLKEIGLNAKMKALAWPAFSKELYGGNPKEAGDLYTVYSASVLADPYGVLYRIFHSKSIAPGGLNLGYSNPKFDSLLDQAVSTISREKRMALYEEMRKVAVADVPYVPILMRPYTVIHRKDVGVYPNTQIGDALGGVFYFYDLYRK